MIHVLGHTDVLMQTTETDRHAAKLLIPTVKDNMQLHCWCRQLRYWQTYSQIIDTDN